MALFSFIIPIYNAEATLKRCLDSILVRITPDYEIILINDSSTDNSLEICEEYAAKYPQVSVYTFPNAGAGAARNRGLEKAKGKYILFCDSDDWYNSEELNKLLDSADEKMHDIDLLCFDYRRVWEDQTEDIQSIREAEYSFDKAKQLEYASSKLLSKNLSIIVWNKIYKKGIITQNNICFPERDILQNKNDWAEDLIFNIEYLFCCKKAVCISNVLYYNACRGTYGNRTERYYTDDQICHMGRMLEFLSKSTVLSCLSETEFAGIFGYHIHNYIYALIKTKTITGCRKIILTDEISKFFLQNIYLILKNHIDLPVQNPEEYNIILRYLYNGNMTEYKLKSALLWKIKAKGR